MNCSQNDLTASHGTMVISCCSVFKGSSGIKEKNLVIFHSAANSKKPPLRPLLFAASFSRSRVILIEMIFMLNFLC